MKCFVFRSIIDGVVKDSLIIATISLFVAVFQWNSWFDVFLYNPNHPHLSTLQYELMKILQNSNSSISSGSAEGAFTQSQSGVQVQVVTPTSVRAAMTIIVSVPIICVYPFLQKYTRHVCRLY